MADRPLQQDLTEFSVLGEEIAKRTFDESGDYTVRPFQFEVKESLWTMTLKVEQTKVFSNWW